ncbi:MAG: sigma-70 family RNA polymerase sigma factor [Bacteroidetes bacterium]|nr:sigma-70 family RNA polymerase sigma factor [Bacteroidota bacterium]
MAEYSLEETLEGIRRNDLNVMQFIYKRYYSGIILFVISNSGNKSDAQDVFQEALVIIFRKLTNGQLRITCTFQTYLYSVCRLLWLKQLEKRNIKNEISADNEGFIELTEETQDTIRQSERYKLYQTHFKKLSEDCQKVLTMSLEKISLRRISVIMGYKSEKYAKKKKFLCREKLVNEIKKDPIFKELAK